MKRRTSTRKNLYFNYPKGSYDPYPYYVWDENKKLIVSGWEHIEDAEDALEELNEALEAAGRKDVSPVILERSELYYRGVSNPEDPKNWYGPELWPTRKNPGKHNGHSLFFMDDQSSRSASHKNHNGGSVYEPKISPHPAWSDYQKHAFYLIDLNQELIIDGYRSRSAAEDGLVRLLSRFEDPDDDLYDNYFELDPAIVTHANLVRLGLNPEQEWSWHDEETELRG